MPPEGAGFLRSNLAALSSSNPALAARIESCAPNPAITFRDARNGSRVPVLRARAGELPFHSLVDPGREAERLVRSLGDCGYLVCLGLGGGFVAAAFLRLPQAAEVLIVEKDASTLKALMGNLSLSPVLSDHRVHLTAGTEEIRHIVRATYLPVIAGGLVSLPVRSWCASEPGFFDMAAEELRGAAEEARADYSVQAHFGKRWFANLISNLPAAQSAPQDRIQARCAHVTAAGPSLENSIAELARRGDESIIVATDTSVPALLKNGVQPEVVVSMDCQLYSYHHFLGGLPEETTLFFDLASPPFLVRRLGARARFFTSAHPFSRFISARWRGFPPVDTTGGNVTHAAVSLARVLGAADVRLHGADFCYPHAKPYARGTYLYDYFHGRQLRNAPAESSLCTFVLGSAGLTAERSDGEVRYRTPMLRDYDSRLRKLVETPRGTPEFEDTGDTAARCDWKEFLGDYSEALRALPRPSSPLAGYFNRLRPEQKAVWATLLPIAARILRETQGLESRDTCLVQSLRWALGRVERAVEDPGITHE